MEFAERLYWFL